MAALPLMAYLAATGLHGRHCRPMMPRKTGSTGGFSRGTRAPPTADGALVEIKNFEGFIRPQQNHTPRTDVDREYIDFKRVV